jgi:hypothetical protein
MSDIRGFSIHPPILPVCLVVLLAPGTSRPSGTIAKEATWTAGESSGQAVLHWAYDSHKI